MPGRQVLHASALKIFQRDRRIQVVKNVQRTVQAQHFLPNAGSLRAIASNYDNVGPGSVGEGAGAYRLPFRIEH